MDNAPTADDAINPEVREALARGGYDFIDFGCSDGGSYKFAMEKLGAKHGIGLDIDPRKVEKARAKGIEAYTQDVTRIAPLADSVRFVTLSHFLEHLPDTQLATRCIGAAIAAASDFVLIRHPFFDSNGPLARLGFKLYSADWAGHRNLMTSYDIWRAARTAIQKGRVSLSLHGRFRIADSSDDAIIPLFAPGDVRKMELERFRGKPLQEFSFPMYKEVVAVIVKHDKKGRPRAEAEKILDALGKTELLMQFPAGAGQDGDGP